MTKESALLDSGATHNFINIRMITRLRVGTRKLKEPREVTNVDGTSNRARKITHYANLLFDYQGKQEVLPVYVTNLGTD